MYIYIAGILLVILCVLYTIYYFKYEYCKACEVCEACEKELTEQEEDINIVNNFHDRFTLQTNAEGNVPSDEGYDIFILMGQSNMVGRGKLEKGIDDDYSKTKHVYQFPYDANNSGSATQPNITGSKIIPAKQPLDFISETKGGSYGEKSNRISMWKGFVENLNKTDRKILLLPLAKGGTSLKVDWKPGKPIYKGAVSAINRSIELNPNNQIKAILWHQGESDSFEPETYTDKFNNFYEQLLKDTPITRDIPFIIGGLKSKYHKTFNPVLENLPEHIKGNLAYVSPSGTKTFDKTHFDAASLRLLGKKYAQVFNEF